MNKKLDKTHNSLMSTERRGNQWRYILLIAQKFRSSSKKFFKNLNIITLGGIV